MANPEHLAILKSGINRWNEWRDENEIIKVNLSDADLRETNLRYANFINANLCNINFSNAYLDNAYFIGADLHNANLYNTNLRYANLYDADFSNADFSNADLSNAELINANLTNTKLINAYFSGANLRGANLRGANLHGANLRSANLRSANLRDANLFSTTFIDANLNDADLSGATFIDADFHNADLRNANLENSNLNEANFGSTIFGFNDLANCINLETTKHHSPSLIEGRTVKFNYNNLPIKFLKGCGLNDWKIESLKLHNPDLTEIQITDIVYAIDRLRNTSPIQPYSIFISYSRKDEPFIEKLEKTFDAKDIRYWRDVHHATAGPLEKQVTSAIHFNPTVLLVLSKDSVQSEWVIFTARKAWELEKKLDRHVICPIVLDDSWKTCSWPERLRQQIEEYNILDFSQWQNQAFFEKQFSKLLKGLNIYYKNQAP